MKKNTLPMASSTTPIMDATKAAKILLLPENDPIIALYRGIELFEAGQRQESLTHFIAAAEQYYLPAIPYLFLLTQPREKLIISAEAKQKIATINAWAVWLPNIDLSYKSHFEASLNQCNRMKNQQELSAKPDNKKILREKKALLAHFKNESTSHYLYHRALYYFEKKKIAKALTFLAHAASAGHLLAVAYFVEKGKAPNQAHPNTKALCDLQLHLSQQTERFATRILYVAERSNEPSHKVLLLNTLAQCAVPFALIMYSELATEKNHRTSSAHPLIAIGVLQDNVAAICALSKLVANKVNLHLPGFDASPKTVLRLLFKILVENKMSYVPFGQSPEEVSRQHHKVTRFYFAMLVNELRNDPDIYNNDELLNYCDQVISTDKHLQESYVHELCSALGNIYLQRQHRQSSIKYLKMLWEFTKQIPVLRDMFYVWYEDSKPVLNNPEADLTLRQSLNTELIATIAILDQHDSQLDLEQHLGCKDYLKYIEYCVETVVREVRFSSNPDDNLLQLHKKYLLLAASANFEKCARLAAIYSFSGKYGFDIDYKKTKQLIFDLTKEEQERFDLIFIAAQAHLRDNPPEPKSAIQLMLKHADRLPNLYFQLAEFYVDGFIGISQNIEQANEYYHKAVQLGDKSAYIGLGILKMHDYDLLENTAQQDKLRQEIFQFFQIAYNAKIADGAFFMGKIYLHGYLDVPCDLNRARQYFQDAVTFEHQPTAHAYLAMMDRGYQGEAQLTLEFELIKQKVLHEHDYHKDNSAAMLELGLLCLNTDMHYATENIIKAAHYNNLNAQYLLAILNCYIELDVFCSDSDAVASIKQHPYSSLMEKPLTTKVAPYIHDFFCFVQLIRQYKGKKYEITTKYIQTILKTELFGSAIDFSIIEDDIKERFAPPEIQQIRLLAKKFSEHEKSGDRECAILTEKLLASSRSSNQNLQRKLTKIRDSGQVSMHNITHSLSAFFSSGGEATKSIKAAMNIHPPHQGREERNFHQPLEGGRAKVANTAIDDMLIGVAFK